MPSEKITQTADELINEIAEVLRNCDGNFIEMIANRVLVGRVVSLDEDKFEHTILFD